MRLNDPLVTSFMYKDKKYDIDLSFDNVLDVFDVMRNKDLRDYEKAEIGLTLLIGEDFEPSVMIELWNYVFGEFIQFNVERTVEYDIKGNPMPVVEDDDEEYLDLEQDAEYIFASFRQAYGINLYDEQGKMTWAEFKEPFFDLGQ